MAINFVRTSSDNLDYDIGSGYTGAFTCSFWVNQPDVSPANYVMAVETGQDSATEFQFILGLWTSNRLQINVNYATTLLDRVTDTGVFTNNVWANCVGRWDGTPTGGVLYVDGTQRPPNQADQDGVGALTSNEWGAHTTLGSGNPNRNDWYLTGRMAECGMWNVELTDSEILALAGGYAPPLVRRSNLVRYWNLLRPPASCYESFTGNLPTVGGAPVEYDHPRIIYPSAQILQFPTSAAPPVDKRGIILGSTTINAMNLGNTAINKAYIGSTEIFN